MGLNDKCDLPPEAWREYVPEEGYEMACINLWWLLSPKDYWYAIISALIGAMIGIWFTIWHLKKQQHEQSLLCVERLKSCIENNIDLLQKAKKISADKKEFPNFPFDTAQFNHWLTQSHDVLDAELFKKLDWQRYQLDHISHKISIGNISILLISTGTPTQQNMQFLNSMYDEVLAHFDTVIRDLTDLSKQIPSKI